MFIAGNTQTHNCLTAICPELPRSASTRRNIHPLTPILIIRYPLSFIEKENVKTSSIYIDPQRPPCSIYMPDSPFPHIWKMTTKMKTDRQVGKCTCKSNLQCRLVQYWVTVLQNHQWMDASLQKPDSMQSAYDQYSHWQTLPVD